MITGSHNPKNYNGIKLVINDKPVSGNEILNILKNNKNISRNSGRIIFKDIKDEYIDEVTKNIQINKNKKIKVVIDCGNGELFGPKNGRLPVNEMVMFFKIESFL